MKSIEEIVSDSFSSWYPNSPIKTMERIETEAGVPIEIVRTAYWKLVDEGKIIRVPGGALRVTPHSSGRFV